MGNTIGSSQRLRVTLGFRSASGTGASTSADIPTLADWALMALAALVAASAWLAFRRHRVG